jgi:hypothetical protein
MRNSSVLVELVATVLQHNATVFTLSWWLCVILVSRCCGCAVCTRLKPLVMHCWCNTYPSVSTLVCIRSGTNHQPSAVAMADPPPKRARLQRLRDKLPHISQSALAAILRIADDEGLPPAASRFTIARARDHCATSVTPYGPIHTSVTLGGESFEIQNPFSMLHEVVKSSPYISSIVAAAAARRQPTIDAPYNLILYADEITPGNQLAYKGDRKFWAIYWTIAEFGTARLSDEVAKCAGVIDVAPASPLPIGWCSIRRHGYVL